MSRIEIPITMELLSDAITGTGYSVPGGEDIDVCRDREGWPYLKGTTLKGLMRESLNNWLAWTGGSEQTLEAIMGTSGWNGLADGRRLQVTSLTLADPPAFPEACFGSRAFTQLEDGIIKEKTLREAVCVHRGLRFSGRLCCDDQDRELLQNALCCIRWVGSMRNRGFGRVCFSMAEPVPQKNAGAELEQGVPFIHYRLLLRDPVIVTHLGRSYGNSFETRDYIPGAAIRGMVLSTLAERYPDWFRENRDKLLNRVRFLNALPSMNQVPAIPAIKGFYEKKDGSGFTSVLLHPDLPEGLKRAKLQPFCTIEGKALRCWKAQTGSSTRILRGERQEDSRPFQVRFLEAGQELDGYIRIGTPELAEKLAEVFCGEPWLGADRYEGFGRCEVTLLEGEQMPGWEETLGYAPGSEPGKELYLLALSPLVMLDQWGEPAGLDESELARLLGVGSVCVGVCSTSMSEYGGYNRLWQCREPSVRMYDQGSIFRLDCDRSPDADHLLRLQHEGLGIRTSEGFGQVLFLRKELYEGIRGKENLQPDKSRMQAKKAALRRARYAWISRTCRDTIWKPTNPNAKYDVAASKSQLGSVQMLCEKAVVLNGDTKELLAMLEHNINERDTDTSDRFRMVRDLVTTVTSTPLSATLGISCPDSRTERLKLLVELFDHSRKTPMKKQDNWKKGGRRS